MSHRVRGIVRLCDVEEVEGERSCPFVSEEVRVWYRGSRARGSGGGGGRSIRAVCSRANAGAALTCYATYFPEVDDRGLGFVVFCTAPAADDKPMHAYDLPAPLGCPLYPRRDIVIIGVRGVRTTAGAPRFYLSWPHSADWTIAGFVHVPVAAFRGLLPGGVPRATAAVDAAVDALWADAPPRLPASEAGCDRDGGPYPRGPAAPRPLPNVETLTCVRSGARHSRHGSSTVRQGKVAVRQRTHAVSHPMLVLEEEEEEEEEGASELAVSSDAEATEDADRNADADADNAAFFADLRVKLRLASAGPGGSLRHRVRAAPGAEDDCGDFAEDVLVEPGSEGDEDEEGDDDGAAAGRGGEGEHEEDSDEEFEDVETEDCCLGNEAHAVTAPFPEPFGDGDLSDTEYPCA